MIVVYATSMLKATVIVSIFVCGRRRIIFDMFFAHECHLKLEIALFIPGASNKHCTNAIQMFCVYWVLLLQSSQTST